MARHELYLCAHLRAAWTDVGGVGVVRRPILRKIVKFSQGLVHLRLEHVHETRDTNGARSDVDWKLIVFLIEKNE